MAVDMFLKLDGVKGESSDDKHKGELDILSWSWGAHQTGTSHVGAGGGAGKVNVQDLSFTKYIDRSSPELFLHCCTGKHFATALLTVRKAGGKPLEYLKINMEEVLVSGVTTGGSGGDERPTESVTLNFARVKLDYTPQKPDGSGDAAVTVGFDMAKNKTI